MAEKKLYMHLLDSEPAMFDGEQIVYGLRDFKAEWFAKDLQQIRKEQIASRKYRESLGRYDCDYKHMIVRLP